MCGIWGIVSKKKTMPTEVICSMVKDLMLFSESRGKEAAGLAVLNKNHMSVMKRSMAANKLMSTKEYKDFMHRNIIKGESLLILGHSRLITNGTRPQNNQPVVKHKISMVHNGIIVNDKELWDRNKELKREYEVDTEIMVELFHKYLYQKDSKSALREVYSQIEGMASTITILPEQRTLLAASNNGSLYYCVCQKSGLVILASERTTIERITQKYEHLFAAKNSIKQLNNSECVSWSLHLTEDMLEEIEFDVDKENPEMNIRNNQWGKEKSSKYEIDFDKIKKIRRCTRCILPETMPFIEFDDKGICNYCRTYKKQEYKGEKALVKWAEKLKKQNMEKNCMVSFSGGRDSSYGLHYFVKELGLKPLTYCYDWGMVTDLARRNQSRMCSKLGVEFILVSADIRKKRENIRKNIVAWLKKPDLGMVPIFMAGDKHYFYYANKVCKEYNIDNVLLASNPFEKTFFKSGFCNIEPDILKRKQNRRAIEQLPIKDVFKMTAYYLKQYAIDTAYINSSLIDTFSAAISYYIIPHNYFRLFDYIEWNEDTVNNVLLNEYDWETSKDTKSTWRIGDGTAPFYNYIYCLVAGFTENDTLRSNQIREGMLTRDEALRLVYQDNMPRFDSMKWYFDVLNLDMDEVLKKVHKIPRLYAIDP